MTQQHNLCYCGVPEELLGRGDRLRKWEKRHLLWAIVDYIPSINPELLTRVYARSFGNWSDVCGLTFEQTQFTRDADFLILTRNIDGAGGTLAEHQLPYGNDTQLRGWFDVGDQWTTDSPPSRNRIDLEAVATHEFGHGIGLPHIKTPGSLMNPFYDPAIRTPQAADIEEAQRRYGPPKKKPAPIPDADYPVRVTIEMASGASYPVLVPANGKWGVG